MRQNRRMSHDSKSQRERFRLDDQTKEARLAQLRQRFQAATPPTRRPAFRWPTDWRRTGVAVVIVVILLAVWLG